MSLFVRLLGKALWPRLSLIEDTEEAVDVASGDNENPPDEATTPQGEGETPEVPPVQTVKIGEEEFPLDEVAKWKESLSQMEKLRSDYDRLNNELSTYKTKAELGEQLLQERQRALQQGQEQGVQSLYFSQGQDPYEGIQEQDLPFWKAADKRVMSMVENRLTHLWDYASEVFGRRLFKLENPDITDDEFKEIDRLIKSGQFQNAQYALQYIRTKGGKGKFYTEEELEKTFKERMAKEQEELKKKAKRSLSGGTRARGGKPQGDKTDHERFEEAWSEANLPE